MIVVIIRSTIDQSLFSAAHEYDKPPTISVLPLQKTTRRVERKGWSGDSILAAQQVRQTSNHLRTSPPKDYEGREEGLERTRFSTAQHGGSPAGTTSRVSRVVDGVRLFPPRQTTAPQAQHQSS